jgi:hypothetical protein
VDGEARSCDLSRETAVTERFFRGTLLKFAAFTFTTANLGDDIQSLAALLFAGRLDALVPRDALGAVALEDRHACIFNCWFLNGRDYRRPSSSLLPFLHGASITRPDVLNSPWKGFLIDNGPVGARDLRTLELLEANGVEAYWSGCLTAFMGERFKRPGERSGVLFVDIDKETERKFVPAEFGARARRLSNFLPPAIAANPFQRLNAAIEMVTELAKARLVVTRRLHAALPCVGLGTPVLVLPDPQISMARWRFSGCESFLPIRYKDEPATDLDFDWADPAPPSPPAELVQARDRLVSSLVRLGLRPAAPLPIDAPASASLRAAGHGLGDHAGKAFLKLGELKREIAVEHWTKEEIRVKTPAASLIPQLSASIEFVSPDLRDRAEFALSDLNVI